MSLASKTYLALMILLGQIEAARLRQLSWAPRHIPITLDVLPGSSFRGSHPSGETLKAKGVATSTWHKHPPLLPAASEMLSGMEAARSPKGSPVADQM
jgi:hypothetical protein